jgi:excisionase family DNA binding protein
MRMDDLPPTLSVEAAGKLLGLSRSSAYRAVERGELPTLQLAGRLHVPTARLLVMLGYSVEPQPDAPPTLTSSSS